MDVHTEDLTDFEKTVDHINRDKLDNRRDNLRFANMSVQNTNRDKAARRCDAKTELPDWLEELPKYVQFRQEIYDKTNNMMRDFFVISHPALDKIWESSKSMNIHLKDKFKATKLKLELLNNNITEQNYNKLSGINDILDLPIGIRIIDKNNKYQFVLDYRKGPNRYNLKKVISSHDIQNELKQFIDEINTKYLELNYQYYTIKNIIAINNIAKNIVIIEKIDIDIAEMKKDLPPNFFITIEKNTNYLSFTKTIDRVKYNMKKVIRSNDLNKEIKCLVDSVNKKYFIQIIVKNTKQKIEELKTPITETNIQENNTIEELKIPITETNIQENNTIEELKIPITETNIQDNNTIEELKTPITETNIQDNNTLAINTSNIIKKNKVSNHIYVPYTSNKIVLDIETDKYFNILQIAYNMYDITPFSLKSGTFFSKENIIAP